MTDERLHRRPTLADVLLGALRRHPRRTAVVTESDSLRYVDVETGAARVAARLAAAGVGRGDTVALLSWNRPEVFMVLLATFCLGARYTALNPFGSRDDHVHICRAVDAAVVVVDVRAYAERATDLAADLPGATVLTIDAERCGGELFAADAQPLAVAAEESDFAVVAYTGGTTGVPKGVQLSHRALLVSLYGALAQWQWPDDVQLLVTTPISHASGLLIPPALVRGGTVHLETWFEPDRVVDLIAERGVTVTFMVPTMIYVLLGHPRIRAVDLSSLRTVMYGAAPIVPDRLGEALDVFGRVFVQLYGQTEAPNTVTVLTKEDHDPTRPQLLRSCGKPMVGLDVAVLADDMSETPQGAIGEVCVRGPLVMDGYLDRPELTDEAFRGGWLHTGDMARVDEDGYLYLVDRKKDLVITGGFNVYPSEIEAVLSTHSDVAAVAVVGLPDEKWGEAVVAFVVRAGGTTVEAAELIGLVRQRKGPVYAPKQVRFVDELPVTLLGKIDKKALRAASEH